MPRIALLDSGSNVIPKRLQDPTLAADIELLDIYDLSEQALSPFAGMLIPVFVDQEWLHSHTDTIRDFLNKGRVVLFSGALFRPWLPGAADFVPKPIHSFSDYALKIVNTGGIFENVSEHDITFKKGVAGFFARGHHPLPTNAEVLVTFESGEPVIYVDRSSTNGTVLLHAGNNLWGIGEEDASTRHILPQLLGWVTNEYRANETRRSSQ